MLLPEMPKSGPSPVQRVKNQQFRFFLAKPFWVAQAMGWSWKQAGKMVSVRSWLLP